MKQRIAQLKTQVQYDNSEAVGLQEQKIHANNQSVQI
jgi:hypothetical protein